MGMVVCVDVCRCCEGLETKLRDLFLMFREISPFRRDCQGFSGEFFRGNVGDLGCL